MIPPFIKFISDCLQDIDNPQINKNPRCEWVLKPNPIFENGWLLIGEKEDGESIFLHKETGQICEMFRE
jgi:hypothetical protein